MKKLLFTTLALIAHFLVFSQTTIKGIVLTNKGETVIGANVILENFNLRQMKKAKNV